MGLLATERVPSTVTAIAINTITEIGVVSIVRVRSAVAEVYFVPTFHEISH